MRKFILTSAVLAEPERSLQSSESYIEAFFDDLFYGKCVQTQKCIGMDAKVCKKVGKQLVLAYQKKIRDGTVANAPVTDLCKKLSDEGLDQINFKNK